MPLSEGGWLAHAPSALPHKEGETPPLALDAAGLDRVREAFADDGEARGIGWASTASRFTARMAICCINSCRRIANQRTDDYGGSLENRMRFPLEVFDAVRAAFPADKPVGVQVSATDWVEGGWDVAQTIAFAQALKKRGVDWIDVSSGGVSPLQKITVGPGYQVPFAQAVKEATGVNTIAVGLITEAQQAEDIIASGKADLVALARGCCTIRAGRGMRRRNLARPSRRRRNIGGRRRTGTRDCSATSRTAPAEARRVAPLYRVGAPSADEGTRSHDSERNKTPRPRSSDRH